MKKKKYEAPLTEHTQVELESGFMSASIFEESNRHDHGVITEEHGFADSSKDWEGDYDLDGWDK